MTIKESLQPTEKSIYISNSSNRYQGESITSPSRKTAILVGVFYITATAAGILSVLFMPDLDAPDYLANLSVYENQLMIAALLEFTMALLIIAISVTLYPILERQNGSLALGYVVARIFESAIFIVGVISLLTLSTLSREFVLSGMADAFNFHTLSALLLAAREWGGAVFSTIFFSLSALILNYILYRSRLIPRWLSGWGLIGATLYLASGFLPLLGHGSQSTIYVLMEAPLGLQEMVFAVWLIVKGFNSSATVPDAARAEIDRE